MTMSHKQIVNRQKDIRDDMLRLSERAEKAPLTEEQEVEWSELREEFDELDEQRKKLERDADLVRVKSLATDQRNVERTEDMDADPLGEPGSVEDRGGFKDPWDTSEIRMGLSPESRGQELRSRAKSAIEKMQGTTDKRREAATRMVEEFDTKDGQLSQQVLATSSPAYLRAFGKLARNGGQMGSLDTEENAAVQRAMSLTDASGGYLVPFQLDPTVIITSDGTFNQVRQAARRVVATGDTWNGVSAGETSWSWDAEASEVSDDASTFAQPSITIHKAAGFVPISIEAAQDEANVANEVARLLASGKETIEATAFTTGSGSGQPFGVVTALNGTSQDIATATAATFVLGDVFALDDALPSRYRFNASWLAHRAVYNDIVQLDTSGGHGLWVQLGQDVPALLRGKRAYESEAMDSASTTTGNEILIFGDFSNYVIADRIGTTVEFIPHLFHTTTNRPSGQRGWYAYFRVGADSVNDGGFRMLSVA